MSEQKHYVGGLVRLKAVFKNAAGDAADPGAVTFKIKPHGGSTTTYVYLTDTQLKKESTGIYYVDYSIAVPYKHSFGFYGTTPVQQAAESSFVVEVSEL